MGGTGQMEDTIVDDQFGKSKHEPILETINADFNRNNDNFGIDILSPLRTGGDKVAFNLVIMSDTGVEVAIGNAQFDNMEFSVEGPIIQKGSRWRSFVRGTIIEVGDLNFSLGKRKLAIHSTNSRDINVALDSKRVKILGNANDDCNIGDESLADIHSCSNLSDFESAVANRQIDHQ